MCCQHIRYRSLSAFVFQLYNLCPAIGVECGGQDAMALPGFLWRNTVERLAHTTRVCKLVTKGRPHLQDRVGKAKLEDAAGNRWVSRHRPKVLGLPGLRATRCIGHRAQR